MLCPLCPLCPQLEDIIQGNSKEDEKAKDALVRPRCCCAAREGAARAPPATHASALTGRRCPARPRACCSQDDVEHLLDEAFDNIAAATGDADKPTNPITGMDYDFAEHFESGEGH